MPIRACVEIRVKNKIHCVKNGVRNRMENEIHACVKNGVKKQTNANENPNEKRVKKKSTQNPCTRETQMKNA